jgi:hypothetical protein
MAQFQNGLGAAEDTHRSRLQLATPHLVNLDTDPQERKPYDYPYVHTWALAHTGKLIQEFQESLKREPLIAVGGTT